jgi:hypothetical protein
VKPVIGATATILSRRLFAVAFFVALATRISYTFTSAVWAASAFSKAAYPPSRRSRLRERIATPRSAWASQGGATWSHLTREIDLIGAFPAGRGGMSNQPERIPLPKIRSRSARSMSSGG